MDIEQTGEFEKDAKKLNKEVKKRLQETIERIIENPTIGKPLGHLKFVFSIRILNCRLVYRYMDRKVLLLCFKSRDEVYRYLRERP